MELQEQCLPAGKLEGKVVSYNRKESGSQKKVWFCGWSLAESVLSSVQERWISSWGIT